jgi:hypothetical protein
MSFEKEFNTMAILYSTGFAHKAALKLWLKAAMAIL